MGTDAPPTPRNDKPRRLLTRTEVAELRAIIGRDAVLAPLLDAYETAVRLLEDVVREDRQSTMPPLDATDVAWLALREAER